MVTAGPDMCGLPPVCPFLFGKEAHKASPQAPLHGGHASRLAARKSFLGIRLIPHLVEAGGVEPTSESIFTGTSPGADGYLHSLAAAQRRHASQLSSFICHAVGKAYHSHVHH